MIFLGEVNRIDFTSRLVQGGDGRGDQIGSRRKKRVRGERTGTGGALSGGVETSYSGNFLESVKVVLMKTHSNGEYRVSTGLLL